VLAHNFRNNYEAAVDSYGTIWQTDNDDDGNRSTRVNYVMQYGNYGYTDELTGAGWRARRTNMEAEIPQRHWHQNDPGSIPNLLINGAGSPAGLTIYEGHLLPAVYQNQMIHCEAGQNSVRAYPVTPDGAGYKAEVKPLLEGVRDQWFRPVDVCVAPDGSLFVADWYDPGVGGHQMGDMTRGRIYRIAPKEAAYKVPALDLKTTEGAIQGLQSPNMATRYLAWHALHQSGAQAEATLQKLWNSDNQRMRARAFWLLASLPGKGASYIQTALQDKNPDIRMAAIRAAVQTQPDVIPFLKAVVKDNNPQVRREAALVLRHNQSPEAANLWAELAMQYDGNDRWYLEALGIGADKQWDAFLQAYQKKAGGQMMTKAGRDIVWRSRTPMALPLLANSITDNATPSGDRLKYFRAFDFINDPAKEQTLLALLDNDGPHKNEIVTTVLNQLDSSSIIRSPKVKRMLDEILPALKGSQQFVDLVGRYKLKDQHEALYQIAISQPDSSIGAQAATLLLKQGGAGLLKQSLSSGNEQTASAVVKVLGRAGNREAIAMMQSVIADKSYKQPVREAAVRTLGDGWGGSEVLLNMVKAGKLPKELEPVAAATFASAYRKDIRQEALKYISSANTSGKPLPPISELVKQSGDVAVGQQVFLRSCATCHQAAGQGANFGPALSQIGSKLAKDALYVAIIHPDAGISFGYEGYVFRLKDGSSVGGVIASETEDAVEVVIPGGIRKRYNRSEVASRRQLENSMMPSNLHQTMTQQELVSLVEFLMAQKGAEKRMANR
jgi:putative heme-binding domain-containing protein